MWPCLIPPVAPHASIRSEGPAAHASDLLCLLPSCDRSLAVCQPHIQCAGVLVLQVRKRPDHLQQHEMRAYGCFYTGYILHWLPLTLSKQAAGREYELALDARTEAARQRALTAEGAARERRRGAQRREAQDMRAQLDARSRALAVAQARAPPLCCPQNVPCSLSGHAGYTNTVNLPSCHSLADVTACCCRRQVPEAEYPDAPKTLTLEP